MSAATRVFNSHHTYILYVPQRILTCFVVVVIVVVVVAVLCVTVHSAAD